MKYIIIYIYIPIYIYIYIQSRDIVGPKLHRIHGPILQVVVKILAEQHGVRCPELPGFGAAFGDGFGWRKMGVPPSGWRILGMLGR